MMVMMPTSRSTMLAVWAVNVTCTCTGAIDAGSIVESVGSGCSRSGNTGAFAVPSILLLCGTDSMVVMGVARNEAFLRICTKPARTHVAVPPEIGHFVSSDIFRYLIQVRGRHY